MKKILFFLFAFFQSSLILAQRGGLGGAGTTSIRNGIFIFVGIVLVVAVLIAYFMYKNFKDQ